MILIGALTTPSPLGAFNNDNIGIHKVQYWPEDKERSLPKDIQYDLRYRQADVTDIHSIVSQTDASYGKITYIVMPNGDHGVVVRLWI